jgi:hypothetical protein
MKLTKEVVANVIALAKKWGYRDGRQDPQGTSGPSRVECRRLFTDCYDNGIVFDTYARAYREGSETA